MGQDLVDVALDVDRRRPGPAAVARAYDAADVHVHVDRPVASHGDRSDVGGIAPRGVPVGAPVGHLERLDRLQRAVGQPEQVRLLGPDHEPTGDCGQTRRRVSLDGHALSPRGAGAFPQRAAVDDGPLASAVDRERGQGFAGKRLYGDYPIAVELPEAFARPDLDPRRHGPMILARARRCEAHETGLDSKSSRHQHLTTQGGHGMFSQKLISSVLGLSLLSLAATGCGTATGAAVGAGSGAAVGAGTGYGAGKGALIGAGVGAAAGAVYDITKHNKKD